MKKILILTISAVLMLCCMVGCGAKRDPKYFGKCFKAEIGMTPTEYKVENSVN